MSAVHCISCHNSKAPLHCGICAEATCKSCAQFVEEETFSFLQKVPPELSLGVYCSFCFDAKIAPEIESYKDAMERAKDVAVYFSTQGKETRIIRRVEEPVRVQNCPDHDEVLLRLAFLAVKANYNSLVDVEITSKKVKLNGYQTLTWQGAGVPVHVDPKRLNR